MKKILSIVLAIAIIAAFSITAFAAPAKTDKGLTAGETSTNTVDVKIDATSAENLDKVYSVDVAWDSLDFTYTFDQTAENTWNPENHTYTEDGNANANWDKTTANIIVTNHSNEDVAVAAAIDNATKNGVTTTLSNASFDLDTGVGLTYDTADSETIGVAIAGVPSVEDEFTIGTITVTISAK